MSVTVTALHTTPLKGTRMHSVEQIELDERGAAGDRMLFLVDERGRLRNSRQIGALQAVVATLRGARLTLELPDGSAVEGELELGDEIATEMYSRPLVSRVVIGPWAQALSDHCGEPLRLLHSEAAVDRGPSGAASLISRGSLRRLAEQGGAGPIDPRRFRMLIEVEGLDPHAEDAWVGRQLRIGDAVVRFEGHVGRCLITTRDPDTGQRTLPTLDLLRAYRSDVTATEPLPFGIHGRVLQPGTVRVGDTVEPAAGAGTAA